MVKKLQDIADSELASSVRASAQQIWLAGMGAFAKAQQEGSKVFEALVKEGATLQKKTQSTAEERFGDVASKMTALAGDMQSRAGQQWDKLESIFEERVSKALGRLGVPANKELEALRQRVDQLTAQVAKLSKASRPSVSKSAARPAASGAVKRAVKRVSARKATPTADEV